MAFHRRKFVLVNFSDGGGLRGTPVLVLDEGVKVEKETWVVRVLMVLAMAELVHGRGCSGDLSLD